MGIFGRKSADHDLRESVKNSFARVKDDTGTIFQWLGYLYQKSTQQEQAISELSRNIERLSMQLGYMPKSKEEVREIVDGCHSTSAMRQKMGEIGEKIDRIVSVQDPVLQRMDAMESRISGIEASRPPSKASIKEKILKRLTRNSKEYIKNIIISTIRKYERISALQLRDMVVEEQGICSKSSFYRLLEEIEESEDIGVVEEGREKVFLSKISGSMRNK